MRRKEDDKQNTELLLKKWMERMTTDGIVLSRDRTSMTIIASKPVNSYNMVNGYKNKRREELIRLLLRRK
jgi:hypothetical protein